MLRLSLEDRLQQFCALQLVGIGLVAGRSRDIEGDGIGDLGLVVLGIALSQRRHSLEVGLHARAVIDLVMVGVEHQQGIDVITFALRASSKCLGLLQRGKPERQILRRWRCMGVIEQAEGDTPIGDRALGVRLEHVLEDFLRLAIPERMLITHRTIEPPLRGLIARGIEVNGAELLICVLGACRWQPDRGLERKGCGKRAGRG